jgi:glutamine cyclotransferase
LIFTLSEERLRRRHCRLGPNLIEWTWQTHVGFALDRFSLKIVRQFHNEGEGWGMTRTANELITSDGTAILRFRNPDTVDETHHIVVRDGHKIVDQLNELEYIEGDIYANVWYSDRIARISPQDRHVIAWIDLTGLLPANRRSTRIFRYP